MEFLEWWNLVFELPFFAAVIFTLVLASGIMGDGGTDMDHDVSIDHDFDHDIGGDHDIEHESESFGLKALSFFGFGKVPVSILLTSFCFIWGFSGFAMNLIFKDVLRFPLIYFWFSAGIAAFNSVFITKYFAGVLAAIMPATETYALKNEDFVGTVAITRYSVTEKSGSATFYDEHKAFQEVPCRVFQGKRFIPANTRVILMKYDAEEKIFFVRVDPFSLDDPRKKIDV